MDFGAQFGQELGTTLESLGLRLLQLDTPRSLDEIVDQLTTEVDPSCMLLIIGNHWGLPVVPHKAVAEVSKIGNL